MSEVVIGAPYEVSREMMDHFRVDLVCHGHTPVADGEAGDDPYYVPKQLNKFKAIESGNTLTTELLVQRIINNRLSFQERNRKKEEKEAVIWNAMQQQQQQQKWEF